MTLTPKRLAEIAAFGAALRNTDDPASRGESPWPSEEGAKIEWSDREWDPSGWRYRLNVGTYCTFAIVPYCDENKRPLKEVADAISGAGLAIFELLAENAALRATIAANLDRADMMQAIRSGTPRRGR